MRLGELINLLEGAPETMVVRYDNGSRQHDNGEMYPSVFASWRGSYSELTLIPDGHYPVTAGSLLRRALSATKEPFPGYKGGHYNMSRDTRLWADLYGASDGFAITDWWYDRQGVVLSRVNLYGYLYG